MIIHFHLRRVGRQASQSEVGGRVNFIDLLKNVTIVGRSTEDSDYVLKSENVRSNIIISRRHARIVATTVGYRLHDDSLNGIFVNDVKIDGSTILDEGDIVVFGHPAGNAIKRGERVRQPESEYQFLFERCSCQSPGIDMQRRLPATTGQQYSVIGSRSQSSELPALQGPNSSQQVVRHQSLTSSQTAQVSAYRYETELHISVPAANNMEATVKTPDHRRAIATSHRVSRDGDSTRSEVAGVRPIMPLYPSVSSPWSRSSSTIMTHAPLEAHSSSSLIVQVDLPQDLSRSASRTPIPEDLSVPSEPQIDSYSYGQPQNICSAPVIPVMDLRADPTPTDLQQFCRSPDRFVKVTRSQSIIRTIVTDRVGTSRNENSQMISHSQEETVLESAMHENASDDVLPNASQLSAVSFPEMDTDVDRQLADKTKDCDKMEVCKSLAKNYGGVSLGQNNVVVVIKDSKDKMEDSGMSDVSEDDIAFNDSLCLTVKTPADLYKASFNEKVPINDEINDERNSDDLASPADGFGLQQFEPASGECSSNNACDVEKIFSRDTDSVRELQVEQQVHSSQSVSISVQDANAESDLNHSDRGHPDEQMHCAALENTSSQKLLETFVETVDQPSGSKDAATFDEVDCENLAVPQIAHGIVTHSISEKLKMLETENTDVSNHLPVDDVEGPAKPAGCTNSPQVDDEDCEGNIHEHDSHINESSPAKSRKEMSNEPEVVQIKNLAGLLAIDNVEADDVLRCKSFEGGKLHEDELSQTPDDEVTKDSTYWLGLTVSENSKEPSSLSHVEDAKPADHECDLQEDETSQTDGGEADAANYEEHEMEMVHDDVLSQLFAEPAASTDSVTFSYAIDQTGEEKAHDINEKSRSDNIVDGIGEPTDGVDSKSLNDATKDDYIMRKDGGFQTKHGMDSGKITEKSENEDMSRQSFMEEAIKAASTTDSVNDADCEEAVVHLAMNNDCTSSQAACTNASEEFSRQSEEMDRPNKNGEASGLDGSSEKKVSKVPEMLVDDINLKCGQACFNLMEGKQNCAVRETEVDHSTENDRISAMETDANAEIYQTKPTSHLDKNSEDIFKKEDEQQSEEAQNDGTGNGLEPHEEIAPVGDEEEKWNDIKDNIKRDEKFTIETGGKNRGIKVGQLQEATLQSIEAGKPNISYLQSLDMFSEPTSIESQESSCDDDIPKYDTPSALTTKMLNSQNVKYSAVTCQYINQASSMKASNISSKKELDPVEDDNGEYEEDNGESKDDNGEFEDDNGESENDNGESKDDNGESEDDNGESEDYNGLGERKKESQDNEVKEIVDSKKMGINLEFEQRQQGHDDLSLTSKHQEGVSNDSCQSPEGCRLDSTLSAEPNVMKELPCTSFDTHVNAYINPIKYSSPVSEGDEQEDPQISAVNNCKDDALNPSQEHSVDFTQNFDCYSSDDDINQSEGDDEVLAVALVQSDAESLPSSQNLQDQPAQDSVVLNVGQHLHCSENSNGSVSQSILIDFTVVTKKENGLQEARMSPCAEPLPESSSGDIFPYRVQASNDKKRDDQMCNELEIVTVPKNVDILSITSESDVVSQEESDESFHECDSTGTVLVLSSDEDRPAKRQRRESMDVIFVKEEPNDYIKKEPSSILPRSTTQLGTSIGDSILIDSDDENSEIEDEEQHVTLKSAVEVKDEVYDSEEPEVIESCNEDENEVQTHVDYLNKTKLPDLSNQSSEENVEGGELADIDKPEITDSARDDASSLKSKILESAIDKQTCSAAGHTVSLTDDKADCEGVLKTCEIPENVAVLSMEREVADVNSKERELVENEKDYLSLLSTDSLQGANKPVGSKNLTTINDTEFEEDMLEDDGSSQSAADEEVTKIDDIEGGDGLASMSLVDVELNDKPTRSADSEFFHARCEESVDDRDMVEDCVSSMTEVPKEMTYTVNQPSEETDSGDKNVESLGLDDSSEKILSQKSNEGSPKCESDDEDFSLHLEPSQACHGDFNYSTQSDDEADDNGKISAKPTKVSGKRELEDHDEDEDEKLSFEKVDLSAEEMDQMASDEDSSLEKGLYPREQHGGSCSHGSMRSALLGSVRILESEDDHNNDSEIEEIVEDSTEGIHLELEQSQQVEDVVCMSSENENIDEYGVPETCVAALTTNQEGTEEISEEHEMAETESKAESSQSSENNLHEADKRTASTDSGDANVADFEEFVDDCDISLDNLSQAANDKGAEYISNDHSNLLPVENECTDALDGSDRSSLHLSKNVEGTDVFADSDESEMIDFEHKDADSSQKSEIVRGADEPDEPVNSEETPTVNEEECVEFTNECDIHENEASHIGVGKITVTNSDESAVVENEMEDDGWSQLSADKEEDSDTVELVDDVAVLEDNGSQTAELEVVTKKSKIDYDVDKQDGSKSLSSEDDLTITGTDKPSGSTDSNSVTNAYCEELVDDCVMNYSDASSLTASNEVSGEVSSAVKDNTDAALGLYYSPEKLEAQPSSEESPNLPDGESDEEEFSLQLEPSQACHDDLNHSVEEAPQSFDEADDDVSAVIETRINLDSVNKRRMEIPTETSKKRDHEDHNKDSEMSSEKGDLSAEEWDQTALGKDSIYLSELLGDSSKDEFVRGASQESAMILESEDDKLPCESKKESQNQITNYRILELQSEACVESDKTDPKYDEDKDIKVSAEEVDDQQFSPSPDERDVTALDKDLTLKKDQFPAELQGDLCRGRNTSASPQSGKRLESKEEKLCPESNNESKDEQISEEMSDGDEGINLELEQSQHIHDAARSSTEKDNVYQTDDHRSDDGDDSEPDSEPAEETIASEAFVNGEKKGRAIEVESSLQGVCASSSKDCQGNMSNLQSYDMFSEPVTFESQESSCDEDDMLRVTATVESNSQNVEDSTIKCQHGSPSSEKEDEENKTALLDKTTADNTVKDASGLGENLQTDESSDDIKNVLVECEEEYKLHQCDGQESEESPMPLPQCSPDVPGSHELLEQDHSFICKNDPIESLANAESALQEAQETSMSPECATENDDTVSLQSCDIPQHDVSHEGNSVPENKEAVGFYACPRELPETCNNDGNPRKRAEKELAPISLSPCATQLEVNINHESTCKVTKYLGDETLPLKFSKVSENVIGVQSEVFNIGIVSGADPCPSTCTAESGALFSESIPAEPDLKRSTKEGKENLPQMTDHQFSDADDDEHVIPTSQPVHRSSGRRQSSLSGVGVVGSSMGRGMNRQCFNSIPMTASPSSIVYANKQLTNKRPLSNSDEENDMLRKKPKVETAGAKCVPIVTAVTPVSILSRPAELAVTIHCHSPEKCVANQINIANSNDTGCHETGVCLTKDMRRFDSDDTPSPTQPLPGDSGCSSKVGSTSGVKEEPGTCEMEAETSGLGGIHDGAFVSDYSHESDKRDKDDCTSQDLLSPIFSVDPSKKVLTLKKIDELENSERLESDAVSKSASIPVRCHLKRQRTNSDSDDEQESTQKTKVRPLVENKAFCHRIVLESDHFSDDDKCDYGMSCDDDDDEDRDCDKYDEFETREYMSKKERRVMEEVSVDSLNNEDEASGSSPPSEDSPSVSPVFKKVSPVFRKVSPVFKKVSPVFKKVSRSNTPMAPSTRLSNSFERKPLEIKPLDENIVSTCPSTFDRPVEEEEEYSSSQPETKKRKLAAALKRLGSKYGNISDHTRGSQETPGELSSAGQTRRRILTSKHGLSVSKTLQRTKHFLEQLLDNLTDGRFDSNERIQGWRKEISVLKAKLNLPHTVIAVVGDTGAGKSSLMNALLDHGNIIPTSGIRACTAVVVDINHSTTQNYEADIEFLQKKEWQDELDMLIKMMVNKEGKIVTGEPDPDKQPDAASAWAKVKAVYGPVFKAGITVEQLKQDNAITQWLGKIRIVKHEKPKQFRDIVNQFIEATSRHECQWWPIVKKVSLRIPNCEVCCSGATLVDLPGIRDSNAARDRIAKDHMKNCNAVWVVASISRAVDNKTAKALLGEHFRRQLLMDGQYGAVSFVCTQTDNLMSSELIRNLELDDKTAEYDAALVELRDKLNEVKSDLLDKRAKEKEMASELSNTMQDLVEDEKLLDDLYQAVEDDIDRELAVQMRHLEDVVAVKKQQRKQRQKCLKEMRNDLKDLKHQIYEIEKLIAKQQKLRSVICAKERNSYAVKEIRRDFKAGIKEMYRKARGVNSDDEESDDEDDEREAEKKERQLKVFCVSASDYLKVTRLLDSDGESVVFDDKEDTGIPALRSFVHEMTKEHQEKSAKKVVACVHQLVTAIHTYLLDQGTEDINIRETVKRLIQQKFATCEEDMLSRCIGSVLAEIDILYNQSLEPKLCEGKGEAVQKAPATVSKWGMMPNRQKKELGGYCWATYKAIVRRYGEYKSAAAGGAVNFNEDLSSPAYNRISVVWNQVFNVRFPDVVSSFIRRVARAVCAFADSLASELIGQGIPAERLHPVRSQVAMTATTKLSQSMDEVLNYVSSQQRDINRVMTTIVKDTMVPAYDACTAESGSGQFLRMKTILSNHVDIYKTVMFDQASMELLGNLHQLKVQIFDTLRLIIKELMKTIMVLYEPLWTCPTNAKEIQEAVLPGVSSVLRKSKLLALEIGINLPQRLSGDSESSSTPGLPSGQPHYDQKPRTSSTELCYAEKNVPRCYTSLPRSVGGGHSSVPSTYSRSSSPEFDIEMQMQVKVEPGRLPKERPKIRY